MSGPAGLGTLPRDEREVDRNYRSDEERMYRRISFRDVADLAAQLRHWICIEP
jgi:hypothetical protein